ncbi:MAG: KTSC domain-containing protein [Methanoregula sp.]|jgi:hypothetical protein|nr:KTSC domain-containing protein [Methanoregula sp.]
MERKTMNMVWDRYESRSIRELGYDSTTKTMAVVFADKTKKFHSPVPYQLYASIHHSTFPERLYRQTVDGKIPVVRGS